jgi:hypothetical protein
MAEQQIAYSAVKVQEVITLYEQLYSTGPDSIAWCILDAKKEQDELYVDKRISKTGIVMGSETGRRLKYVMPSNLYIMLRKKFPTIFSKDVKKFERDFPVFFKGWR